MMGSSSLYPEAETSALVARGPQHQSQDNKQKKQGRPWCEACHKPGHTKDICWKIHGKPANWKPRQPPESKGYMTNCEDKSSPEPTLFSKEQMEFLQKMFSHQMISPVPTENVLGTGSVAQTGNYSTAMNTQVQKHNSWIVDSGASDHMTGNAKLFSAYKSNSENLMVRIADGSLSKVAGIGSVTITENLTLNSVLLVPNLTCNLLSVSKLAKDLNWVTHFFSNHCEFQDLESGRMIGNAKEFAGLYILNSPSNLEEQAQAANYVSCPDSCNNKGAILLWLY